MQPDGEFRGRLLWEGSETRLTKQLWAFKHEYESTSLVLLFLVIVFSVFAITLATYGVCIGVAFPLAVLVTAISLKLVADVLVRRYIANRQPDRVYEAGYTEYGLLGQERFVPWAACSGVRALASYKDDEFRSMLAGSHKVRDCLVVEGPGGQRKVLNVGKGNFERILRVARYQVGDAERVPGYYDGVLRRRLLLSAPKAFALALLFGAVLGAFATIFGFLVGRGAAGAVLAALAFATLIYVPILCVMEPTQVSRGHAPLRHKLGVVGTVVLICLSAYAVTSLGLSSMDYERTHLEFAYPGPSGIPMGEHRGAEFNLTEPVTVVRNETLLLENCSVVFNLPWSEIFGFWVEEGGHLEMRNTTVSASPREWKPAYGIPDEPFLMQLSGYAWIEGCVLDNLGGWRDGAEDEGGLKVMSDDVTLLNTTVRSAYANGVVTHDCSPRIEGCTILDAWGDGIQCHGGAPSIELCYIRGCRQGISLDRSDAHIEACEIRGGTVGVRIIGSDPTLVGCGVMDASEAAVTYDRFSDPDISNLTLIDNGAGVELDRWMPLGQRPLAMQLDRLCLPIYLLLGLVGVYPLYRRPRKGKAREKRARCVQHLEKKPEAQTVLEPDPFLAWANDTWDKAKAWMLAPFAIRVPKNATPSVRDRPAGPFPSNRGALFTWMPSDVRGSTWERSRGLLMLAPFLVMVGALVSWAYASDFEWLGTLAVTLAAYVVLASMYPWCWLAATSRLVLEVYENGVLAAGPLGRPRFYPWAELGGVEERTSLLGFRVLTVDAVRGRVRIDERLPKYTEVKHMADERVRQAENMGRDPGDTPRRELLTGLSKVLVLWVGLSVAATAFVLRDGIPAPHADARVVQTLGALMCVLMGLPLVFHWSVPFAAERRYRLDVRVALVAFVVAFMLAAAAFGGIYMENAVALNQRPVTAAMQDDPGASSVIATSYIGVRLIADGPVVVHEGETLSLVDSELVFDPVPGDDYGIWVAKGGRLVMLNSTVGLWDEGAGFTFEVHGSATIRGCRVEGTATWSEYDWLYHVVDSGLEIYSSDVLVEDTLFENARGRAICTFECSPVIRGCTVNGSLSSGLFIARGTPTVEDCTITRCARAMYVEDSAVIVRDCNITGNEHGIYLDHSDAIIQGCFFDDNGGESLGYDADESEPVLRDNRFASGWPDIVLDDISGNIRFMFLVILLTIPFGIAYLVGGMGYKHAKETMMIERFLARGGNGPKARAGQKPARTLVKCPRCGLVNVIRTEERPYEFGCKACGALLRLSR